AYGPSNIQEQLTNNFSLSKVLNVGTDVAWKVVSFFGSVFLVLILTVFMLTAARKLWATGEKKAALGLLYRAAISSLVSQDLVEIEESDTESDCLRRLGGKKLAELAYFSALTNAWMSAAYAKVTPDEATMDQLCAEWPFKGRRKV
ncbi:DUF4129 domain-containing protein, partial [Akkermansiaceae bacterium]|nr:DUF4129 domain-containing protein [Akkermansiaceae bacterium]